MSNEYIKNEIDKIMNDSKYTDPLNAAMCAAWIMGNHKGVNLKVLDVKEINSLSDYCILGSASNPTQAQAMADTICFHLKRHGRRTISKEGIDNSDWILLDFGDIIIHIFQENTRDFYDLDKLWQDAKIIQIPESFYFSAPTKEIVVDNFIANENKNKQENKAIDTTTEKIQENEKEIIESKYLDYDSQDINIDEYLAPTQEPVVDNQSFKKGVKKTKNTVAKTTTKKAVKKVAKTATKKAVKKVAKTTAKKTVKKVAKTATKKAVKKVAKTATKKAVKKVAKTATKKAVKKVAKTATKKAVKKVAKTTTKKTVTKVVGKKITK